MLTLPQLHLLSTPEGRNQPWQPWERIQHWFFKILASRPLHTFKNYWGSQSAFVCDDFLFCLFVCLFVWRPGLRDPNALTRDRTGPTAVKVQSPNHWTAREFPVMVFYYYYLLIVTILYYKLKLEKLKNIYLKITIETHYKLMYNK